MGVWRFTVSTEEREAFRRFVAWRFTARHWREMTEDQRAAWTEYSRERADEEERWDRR
jgi:hypothetical protein